MHRSRTIRWVRAFLPPLVLLLGSACGPDAGGEGAETRRDSAGVRIVDTSARDRPAPWVAERAFALGGADEGPGSFYSLAPGDLDGDGAGNLYVLDRSNGRVVVFDSTGTYVRTLGRPGGGPGELQRPWSLAVGPGDTLWVFDFARRGFTRFAPDGSDVPSVRLPAEFAFTGGAFRVTPAGLLMEEGGMVDAVRLVAMGRRYTVRIASVEAPPGRPVQFESCPMSFTALPPLFHPSLRWAARGERVVVVTGDAYELRLYEGGTLRALVRRPVRPRPVTEAMAVAEVGDAMTVRIEGGTVRCDAAEAARKRGWAGVLPAVREVRLDPAGRIWVRRGHVRGEEGGIDLFGADGGFLGTLPPGTPWPATFLSERRYATIQGDELGVDRAVVYRLAGRGAPEAM